MTVKYDLASISIPCRITVVIFLVVQQGTREDNHFGCFSVLKALRAQSRQPVHMSAVLQLCSSQAPAIPWLYKSP